MIDGVSVQQHAGCAARSHAAGPTARSSSPSAPGRSSKRRRRRAGATEKPDEYFFLEVFGSAVVEHLVTMTGARLVRLGRRRGSAVLPHYSPGYPEWTSTSSRACSN